jgi:hypothetical protein
LLFTVDSYFGVFTIRTLNILFNCSFNLIAIWTSINLWMLSFNPRGLAVVAEGEGEEETDLVNVEVAGEGEEEEEDNEGCHLVVFDKLTDLDKWEENGSTTCSKEILTE